MSSKVKENYELLWEMVYHNPKEVKGTPARLLVKINTNDPYAHHVNIYDWIEEKDSEKDHRRSPEQRAQYPSAAPKQSRQVQVIIRGLFRPSVPSILGDELLFPRAATFEVCR